MLVRYAAHRACRRNRSQRLRRPGFGQGREPTPPTSYYPIAGRPCLTVTPAAIVVDAPIGEEDEAMMRSTVGLTPFVWAALLVCAAFAPCVARAADAPNIVWIVAEDMSANMSCYGETTI